MVKLSPRQPVTTGYMHSVSYVAHQAEQPDDSSTLYSISVQLYVLEGRLTEVTGWEKRKMKWSVDRKIIGNHDEITGAWVKWSGIMGRNRSLGKMVWNYGT